MTLVLCQFLILGYPCTKTLVLLDRIAMATLIFKLDRALASCPACHDDTRRPQPRYHCTQTRPDRTVTGAASAARAGLRRGVDRRDAGRTYARPRSRRPGR